MNSKIIFLRLLLIFFLTGNLALNANAAKDPVYSSMLDGRLPNILVNNASIETEDLVYAVMSSRNRIDLTRPQFYVNTVSLEIAEEDAHMIPADFDCELTLNIQYTSPTGTVSNYNGHKLKVTYRKNQGIKYDPVQYLSFNGAYKVLVTVTNIDDFNANWDVTKFLILYNRIEVTRDYKFNVSAPETITSINNSGNTGTIDELLVNWSMDPLSGYTHFDLEWAWIEDAASDKYKQNGSYITDLVFSNNSSRVTIEKGLGNAGQASYKIPTLYDGSGYLFYRVRPVQYLVDGSYVNGAWNTGNTTSHYFHFDGHENNLNWQATTSYAEEGKRKTVIQYFDGTLRGRQTVTKDNSSNTTVVAETLYDYQGRPAIQILPAPTLSNTIQFSRDFNRFTTSIQYVKDVYDLVPLNSNPCNASTPPLLASGPPNSIVGAAQYYSPNNPLVNTAENKFIPDAEGYPYTETRYTQDGTGRIVAQSGVGIQHKLGSGKETKYFYGSPTQKELDALFGVEVGDASHYFKNMVRDANGQYSVSYVDMTGKTIATALAGTNPDALSPLDSYTATQSNTPVTENLISSANNRIVGRDIIAQKTLLVPKRGNYTFNYQLNPQSAEILACNPFGQTVCYDCTYDLVISIADNCGTFSTQFTASNFSFPPDEECSNPSPALSVINQSVFLEEGEYTITKTLSLNQASQQWYKENVFATKNICKTFQDFYNEIYNVIVQQSNCAPTCNTCNAALGTYEQFKSNYLSAIGLTTATPQLELEITAAYNQNKQACDHLCEKVNPVLENYETLMIQDMSPPYGQFAVRNPSDRMDVDFNIYKSVNGKYPYLNPLNEDGNPGEYKNDLGQKDNSAYEEPDASNNFNSNLLVFTNPEGFEQNFKSSWAKALLPYHPEYCKYKAVKSLPFKASFEFDEKLKAVNSFAEANNAQNNFIAGILNLDPFFNGTGASLKPLMLDLIEDKYKVVTYNNVEYAFSMWQIAWSTIHCLDNGMNISDLDCVLNAPKKPPFNLSSCSGDWNQVWSSFRNMYLTEKARLLNDYLDLMCQSPKLDQFYNNLSTTNYRRIFGSAEQLGNNYNPDAPAGFFLSLTSQSQNSTLSSAPVNNEINNAKEITCRSYVETWKTDLLRCNSLANITPPAERDLVINNIIEQMVDVCKRGFDVNHPMGSSTVKTGDPNPPLSFEEIIRNVLTTRNIPITEICHPFLISYPKPYELQQPLSDYPAATTQDPCVCERLSYVRAKKLNEGFDGTLSEYIRYKHGVTIAQATLDILQNGCDGNPDCVLYEQPIAIPGFFACGAATETCISCEQYGSLLSEFHSQFPTLTNAPYIQPDSDDEHAANLAFEEFMNNRTGFRKNWTEFVRFGMACDNYSGGYDCNFLQQLVTQFHQTHPGLVGQDCRDQFVIFFNLQTGYFYTWPDIVTLYAPCGGLTVCNPTLTCPEFNAILIDFYQWYHSLPLPRPDCKESFINYFNSVKGTDYTTWQELKDLYMLVCQQELNVCDEYPCFIIEYVIMQFRETNVWMYEDCQSRFVEFFNDFFNTSYTEEEVWLIVSRCFDRYNVCAPPYSCETIQQYVNHYTSSGDQNCNSVFPQGTPENCRDCFAQYMNQALGTSYTYAEWELIYKAVCVDILNVCGATYDCPSLTNFTTWFLDHFPDLDPTVCNERFVEEFNAAFNTTYTLREIEEIYLLYCGHLPGICKLKGRPSANDLNVIYSDFRKMYPNPGGYFGNKCEDEFVKFYTTVWGKSIEKDSLIALYNEVLGYMPDICSDVDCAALSVYLNDYQGRFGNYNLPLQMRKDLLVTLYNRKFKPKTAYSWDDLQQIFTFCNVNLSLPADQGTLLTCEKVTAVKKAFFEFHKGSIPGNCKEAFEGFFNFYYKVNMNYQQILEWGTQNCNFNLGICPVNPEDPIVLNVERTPPGTVILPPRLCGLNTPLSPPVTIEEEDPCDFQAILANNSAVEQYTAYSENQFNNFDLAYQSQCLSVQQMETFTVSFVPAEYHYTLYYYDRAGNLVQTVPPEGVQPNRNETYLQQVADFRNNTASFRPATPAHTLKTQYRYNTLNQVIAQATPDAGTSKFWYDKLGRLVLSQNAKQAATNKYSYTLYDDLGRIHEVGETVITGTVNQQMTQDEQALAAVLQNTKYEITQTQYDEAYPPFCGTAPGNTILCQENLRNRVSYTFTKLVSTNTEWEAATFYSYDIHGNVSTLLQDYRQGVMNDANNRFKKIEYHYDLISGKVNEVAYQAGKIDAFYHRYSYDAENRLTTVATSRDKVFWQQEASYKYYKHGPLARTVLGDLRVQGLDYAYTLQGWLKGVNSSSVGEGNFDMGADGKAGTVNELIARDAFGFMLNYFNNDYKPINPTANTVAGSPFVLAGRHDLNNIDGQQVAGQLFNGNIASMFVNIPKLGTANLYGYKYDQLNRIRSMDVFNGFNNTNNTFTGIPSAIQDYKERVSYDANGNILSYQRNGAAAHGGVNMDKLTYQYERVASGKLHSNKLRYVFDEINSAGIQEDIESQTTLATANDVNADLNSSQSGDNYAYDAIGNLIKDTREGISNIEWTVYGKIRSIQKGSTSISYTYDASGNRISKTVNNKTTWYVRDASGNVMSVYEKDNNDDLAQKELHLYGSSRLGIYEINTNVEIQPIPGGNITFTRGSKFFELSNHLGNVLVTISDKKLQHEDAANAGYVDYYEADVITANDYYPFGMQMPGRNYFANPSNYRYGFNGKEKDKETTSTTTYDYGFRIYNPCLGKFLSVDPLTKAYPWYTPYQYAGNKPIRYIDRDGLEEAESDVHNSMVYNTYQIKASITNNLIRLSPNREKRILREEFAKAGITDETYINNFRVRLRTIVTNHPADDANPEGWFEIENKFVVEPKTSFGKEILEIAIDVLSTASVVPSPGSAGFLAARGGGQILISEFRKSMGILYNVKKYSSVGVNNALKGVQKLEDVMEAGMAFVGSNAKKLYTKSGRFEGWESADGLKRFRPSAYKKNQGKFQSNFEQRTSKDVKWDDANKSNMHVDTDKGFDFKSENLPAPAKPAGSGG
jgi:RHS repeat-associated protein